MYEPITINLKELMVLVLAFLGLIGIIFGLGLALAAAKFAVKIDPIIEKVRDVLPGANCGACGYAGCQGYAEAVALRPDVPPNLCTPGKTPVAETIAKITGKIAEKVEPVVARVFCQGATSHTTRRYVYKGIKDCRAAVLAGGGDKSCIYGCLGYGTCAVVCPFDAITMTKDDLPEVDLI
ncbi:MAG: RnfABCDGE type electron transport complex subunit B, partial [Nitrospirota bacterium]